MVPVLFTSPDVSSQRTTGGSYIKRVWVTAAADLGLSGPRSCSWALFYPCCCSTHFWAPGWVILLHLWWSGLSPCSSAILAYTSLAVKHAQMQHGTAPRFAASPTVDLQNCAPLRHMVSFSLQLLVLRPLVQTTMQSDLTFVSGCTKHTEYFSD